MLFSYRWGRRIFSFNSLGNCNTYELLSQTYKQGKSRVQPKSPVRVPRWRDVLESCDEWSRTNKVEVVGAFPRVPCRVRFGDLPCWVFGTTESIPQFGLLHVLRSHLVQIFESGSKVSDIPFRTTGLSSDDVVVSGVSLWDIPLRLPFTSQNWVCLKNFPVKDRFDTLPSVMGGLESYHLGGRRT